MIPSNITDLMLRDYKAQQELLRPFYGRIVYLDDLIKILDCAPSESLLDNVMVVGSMVLIEPIKFDHYSLRRSFAIACKRRGLVLSDTFVKGLNMDSVRYSW